VALSSIFCLQKQGAEVMVCGPKTLIQKYIEAQRQVGTTTCRAALAWCDVAN
jgi:aspartate carbamoyltransferase catalytic subunit